MTKDEICGLLRQIHDVLAMQSEINQVKPVALIDAEIRKAVEAEREACAAKAEQVGQHKNHIGIAAAIRARGQA